jgi:hypothetical protein
MLATCFWTSPTITTKSLWEASSLSILEVKSVTFNSPPDAAPAERSLPASSDPRRNSGEVGARYGGPGLCTPSNTPLVNGWFLCELGDCNGWFLCELGDSSVLLL